MADNTDLVILPETKLQFDGNELVRFDDDEKPIMKIPVDALRRVTYASGINPFGVVLVAAAATIGLIGYELENNTFATVLMYLVGILGGGFGLLTVKQDKLAIQTDSERLVVLADDSKDVIQGFAATLNRRLSAKPE